jgi:hypothetical protein
MTDIDLTEAVAIIERILDAGDDMERALSGYVLDHPEHEGHVETAREALVNWRAAVENLLESES